MTSGSVARRYARALLQLAIEHNAVEQFGRELGQFAALVDGHAPLRDTLGNPSFGLTRRRAIVEDLIQRLSPSPLVRNFVLLLVERERFIALPAITREYAAMADVHAQRIRATVTSARALEPSVVEELKHTLATQTGKQVLLEQRIDPSLIGGLVTQIGSVIYDGSLRTRLQEMRQVLLAGKH